MTILMTFKVESDEEDLASNGWPKGRPAGYYRGAATVSEMVERVLNWDHPPEIASIEVVSTSEVIGE